MEEEIEGAQIALIAADFSEAVDPEFYPKLEKELENYDVSLLVNNVGLGGNSAVLLGAEATTDSLLRCLTVNNTH